MPAARQKPSPSSAKPSNRESTTSTPRSSTATASASSAQKIVQYVGISGHNDPQVIRTAMERFPFDMALIPLNPTEPHHPRTFAKEFLEYARRKGVGLAVMKVMGFGRLVGEGKFTVSELFRYALSHPIHTAVILPNSLRELRELLAAARAFTPMTPDEMRALEARAKPLTDQVAGMYHQWP